MKVRLLNWYARYMQIAGAYCAALCCLLGVSWIVKSQGPYADRGKGILQDDIIQGLYGILLGIVLWRLSRRSSERPAAATRDSQQGEGALSASKKVK